MKLETGVGEAVLVVEGLTKVYGGIRAVDGCSMNLTSGSITALLGPNGSGKSTFFNLVTGIDRPTAGSIQFLGRRINDLKPFQIARLGVGRTFQLTRLFGRMTVFENLRVADIDGGARANRDDRLHDLLKLFNLWEHRERYAATLSYGQQKLLEFARAVIRQPRLVMLDEPFAGINRVMAQKMVELIQHFQSIGITFFLIDHEMKLVMQLCNRVHVMDFGQIIASGDPDEIRKDPRVIEAYFGR
jgi:ABC-type branched-subunit amino acid transport system ATPase component